MGSRQGLEQRIRWAAPSTRSPPTGSESRTEPTPPPNGRRTARTESRTGHPGRRSCSRQRPSRSKRRHFVGHRADSDEISLHHQVAHPPREHAVPMGRGSIGTACTPLRCRSVAGGRYTGRSAGSVRRQVRDRCTTRVLSVDAHGVPGDGSSIRSVLCPFRRRQPCESRENRAGCRGLRGHVGGSERASTDERLYESGGVSPRPDDVYPERPDGNAGAGRRTRSRHPPATPRDRRRRAGALDTRRPVDVPRNPHRAKDL